LSGIDVDVDECACHLYVVSLITRDVQNFKCTGSAFFLVPFSKKKAPRSCTICQSRHQNGVNLHSLCTLVSKEKVQCTVIQMPPPQYERVVNGSIKIIVHFSKVLLQADVDQQVGDEDPK
jgi:hypothetical protein